MTLKGLPRDGRPLLLYLQKSRVFYELLVSALLARRDFCPVDAAQPVERVIRIAQELRDPLVLVDDKQTAEEIRVHGIDCRVVAELVEPLDKQLAPQELPSEATPHYYIATSGSTGRPKLVQVRHDATCAFTAWAIPFYRVNGSTRWAQFSSIGFDLTLVDVLTVLLGGGTLVAVTTEAERLRPDRFLIEHKISHWHSVPTMIPYLTRRRERTAPAVECFTFCGEPLLKSHCESLRQLAPQARVINTYGPTEGTLFCSFHEVGAGDLATSAPAAISIGQAIPGWNFVFLADESGLQLFLLGEHLAEGYLNSRADAFQAVEVQGREVGCFRTGDYFDLHGARYYFSHRRDGLVKVGGNRVDLGEVADACRRSGIDQPVLVHVNGEIVLCSEGAELDGRALVAALKERLPAYAIPRRIISMPTLPRNSNGKVDRQQLSRQVETSG